jgi:copper(I)-binding protein
MILRFALALLLCGVLAVPSARAADAPPSGITISEAWSRATPPGASTGVVYLTITDAGPADALIAVSAPVAAKAAVHESKTVNGVMQMQPVDSLAVDANLPVRLAPNGYHVMLEGLMHPLKAGDHFPVTLTFEHAGEITATVHVQALGAAGPAAHDMDGMHMDH